MREAVGLPRPPGPLPNAFLVQDLTEHTPMRMRIEAAERLVLAGAVEEDVLFAAYLTGEPAASGGIWDRAEAVQALEAALASGTDVPARLAAADAALSERGLRVFLARACADRLAALDPRDWPQADRDRLAQLLLLAGRPEAAAAVPATGPSVAVPLAIATAAPAPDAPTELARFAVTGLTATEAADDRERGLAELVAAGRQGEALLHALALVADGPEVDPQGLRSALLALRLAGQEKAARAIAVETLLAGPAQ